jgi:hypothetical protein
MPAALDLTGRTFGSLTVLSRGPAVKFGRLQSSWVCRCACGAIITLPQNRLPHRPTLPRGHAVTACDQCRARPCVICGAPILPPSTAATCSDACALEYERAYQRNWKAEKYRSDPAERAKRAARASDEWRALSPEARREINRKRRDSEGAERINERARQAHAQRMTDPAYRERRREKSRKLIEANPEKWKATQREAARRKRAVQYARELGDIATQIIKAGDEN